MSAGTVTGRFDLFRSDDLLSLEIELVDLALQPAAGGGQQLVPTSDRARLVVRFPPQHLFERAFAVGSSPSFAPARLSGPSRLVFRVRQPMPFTLASLLGWDRGHLEAIVPSPLAALAETETAIELPFRMLLAPDRTAVWRHRIVSPVSVAGSDRWVELWHTSLDAAAPGSAVWIAGVRQPEAADPFTPVSVGAVDRAQLARQSRDATAALPAGGADIPVSRLILSSLGASLDLQGAWSGPSDTRPAWRHIASFGRDHYVRVAVRGFLHPFGHRAAVTDVTERTFGPNGTAHLEKYQLVTVVESEKTFAGRDMPFRRVRLETAVTPPVMVDTVAGGTILVGGQPFPFQLTAFDWEDHPVTFSLPLTFVPQGVAHEPFSERLRVIFADLPPLGRAVLAGQAVSYAEARVAGQESTKLVTQAIDFVTRNSGATSLSDPPFLPAMERAAVAIPAVDQLFGGQRPVEVRLAQTYLDHAFGQANPGQLFMEMAQAGQSLPAKAQQMGGMIAPTLNFVGLSRELGPVSGQGATAAQALSDIASGRFSPASFLGTATKLFGSVKLTDLLPAVPFAAPGAGAPDQFDVEKLLSELNALSGLSDAALADKLREKLETVVSGEAEKFIKVPAMSTRALRNAAGLPDGVEITYLWKPVVSATSIPLIKTTPKSRFWLLVRVTAQAGAEPASRVEGHFTNFNLPLLDVMVVEFKRVRFRSARGIALDLKPEIGKVTFAGPLDFINDLQTLLSVFGIDSPFGLEIQPTYLRATYALGLPAFSVGAFAIENLRLSAALKLPFVESAGPISIRFALGERSAPFLVTYSLLAGGGFFALELDAGGNVGIEGAIEIGGKFSFSVVVAKGGVHALAGIYFSLKNNRAGKLDAHIEGYVRAGGFVEILGIVGVTVEFYLGLRYSTGANTLTGTARVNACIEVLFFNECVGFEVSYTIAGPGGRDQPAPVDEPLFRADVSPAAMPVLPPHPTFTDLIAPADWDAYRLAFA